MQQSAANPYLQMDLQTAAPERLIERLLERAVQLVETSAATGAGNPAAIAKAIDIVAELRSALDMEVGGEIARNLDALYQFSTERLLIGHAEGDAEILREAGRVLENVAETWSELVRQRETKP